jgi:hypothetical protein
MKGEIEKMVKVEIPHDAWRRFAPLVLALMMTVRSPDTALKCADDDELVDELVAELAKFATAKAEPNDDEDPDLENENDWNLEARGYVRLLLKGAARAALRKYLLSRGHRAARTRTFKVVNPPRPGKPRHERRRPRRGIARRRQNKNPGSA